MGDGTSTRVIYRVQSYLDALKSTKLHTVIFVVKEGANVRKTAHLIRQAFRVAKRFEISPYDKMNWTVKETRTSIICERKEIGFEAFATVLEMKKERKVLNVKDIEEAITEISKNPQDRYLINVASITPEQQDVFASWAQVMSIQFSFEGNSILINDKQ